MWGTQDVARAPLGTAGHRRVERHRLPGHLAGGTHGWGSGTGSELGENTVSSSHEQTTDIRGVGVRHARGSPKSRAPTAPLSNPCCLCVSTTTKKRHFFSGGRQQSGGLGEPGRQRAWLCLHGTARTPAKASELQQVVGSPASRRTELQEPPVPRPGSQSPNSRASVCTQNKVNIVQSKGKESPRLPWGAPCVICSPVPSQRGEASGADPCVWTETPHPPAHRQTPHLQQGAAASPALHAASGSSPSPARGTAGPGDNPVTNKKQVLFWRESPPGGCSPTAPRSQRHREGCPSAGGDAGCPSSNNGSFPSPGAGGRQQHTSMHPQTPRPLPTRQCHARGLQSAVESVGAGGGRRRGQGWAAPPGPGLATGRQPILRMECRATVQQPRSSELML